MSVYGARSFRLFVPSNERHLHAPTSALGRGLSVCGASEFFGPSSPLSVMCSWSTYARVCPSVWFRTELCRGPRQRATSAAACQFRSVTRCNRSDAGMRPTSSMDGVTRAVPGGNVPRRPVVASSLRARSDRWTAHRRSDEASQCILGVCRLAADLKRLDQEACLQLPWRTNAWLSWTHPRTPTREYPLNCRDSFENVKPKGLRKTQIEKYILAFRFKHFPNTGSIKNSQLKAKKYSF